MLKINKLISHSAVDFAAEELKKYLRMMMPEGGDIKIAYAPEAKDGFRLGLMQELGLDVSDAEEPELDDILYIDCDTKGGIIAGDNPRSVLLAVYEYLRHNGCRWLMPGVDGEFIPMKDIEPVKYRHKPSCRYRGWCNEGAEYQPNMLEAIDFAPKVGMNVFMMEFRIPTSYYKRYYDHMHNEENRPRESVTPNTILQWKRECEVEIAKRGLQFHDIGHGWGSDAFGIDSSLRAWDGDNDARISDEQRKYLAMVGGKRKLTDNTPNYTQFCMGNPEARTRVAEYIADYAEKHSNADYLHVWLGDGTNNHCECELCRPKIAPDWYVMLLNEIDERLTARGLSTRIVFIVYVDTTWAPLTEVIKNQERFTLLFAPITRSYCETLSEDPADITLRPFVFNKNAFPEGLAEYLAYLGEWQKMWHGACMSYEYHFWRHQYYDVANIELSRLINEDVRVYKKYGVNGIIEDGSQRSFFPTGLAFYTYARSLFNCELTAEEIAEDYMSHAFGEHWREFYAYLKELGEAFDRDYMERKKSRDPSVSPFYNPEQAKRLEEVPAIVAKGRELIKAHYNSEYRVRTVSVRLLELHCRYAELLADFMREKALGNDAAADEKYGKLRLECGKQEVNFERYYDHTLAFYSLDAIRAAKSNLSGVDSEIRMEN